MFKEPNNPKIAELTKSFRKRAYLLSNLESIKLNGINRNCVWCLKQLSGKRLKWCSEGCINSALAWARPQCEQGLHVLLFRQNFKCKICGYDYLPYVKQAASEVGLHDGEITQQISFYMMRVFRGLLPREYRAEVDHVIAISLGGTSIGLDNHRVLCSKCHKTKTSEERKLDYAKNGHPVKGRKATPEQSEHLSQIRKGKDSECRYASRQKNLYPLVRIPIIATNLATGEEKKFDSIDDAAFILKLQSSNISRVLRFDQKRKQHKGWTFRYA